MKIRQQVGPRLGIKDINDLALAVNVFSQSISSRVTNIKIPFVVRSSRTPLNESGFSARLRIYVKEKDFSNRESVAILHNSVAGKNDMSYVYTRRVIIII